MRNTSSQRYGGQAAQRGCLSAPITHSIRRTAKHPCCCQLGSLVLHSRARVKQSTQRCWQAWAPAGAAQEGLATKSFSLLTFSPWIFTPQGVRWSRAVQELAVLVAAPEVLGRLTGLGYCLLFWVRRVLPCACSSPGFWGGSTWYSQQWLECKTKVWIPRPPCAAGSFLCGAEFSWQKYSQKHKLRFQCAKSSSVVAAALPRTLGLSRN